MRESHFNGSTFGPITMVCPVRLDDAMEALDSEIKEVMREMQDEDDFVFPPLCEAAESGDLVRGQQLLEAQADAPVIKALSVAASKGHLDFVNLLLSTGKIKLEDTDYYDTPLFSAFDGPHPAVIKRLIEAGAPDKIYYLGLTALHLAARLGYIQIAKQLLARGANPQASLSTSARTNLWIEGVHFTLRPFMAAKQWLSFL